MKSSANGQASDILRAVIHEEEGGYWAEIPELPGCYTQADSLDELLRNLREAVSLYLQDEDVPRSGNYINLACQ